MSITKLNSTVCWSFWFMIHTQNIKFCWQAPRLSNKFSSLILGLTVQVHTSVTLNVYNQIKQHCLLILLVYDTHTEHQVLLTSPKTFKWIFQSYTGFNCTSTYLCTLNQKGKGISRMAWTRRYILHVRTCTYLNKVERLVHLWVHRSQFIKVAVKHGVLMLQHLAQKKGSKRNINHNTLYEL